MKKTFIALTASVLITSCASTAYLSDYCLDYSRYSKVGFTVSPLSDHKEEYTPIATVGTRYKYNPAVDEIKTYTELLDIVVKNTISKGGNALLGLETRAYSDSYGNYIEVEGVAVKLENRPPVSLARLAEIIEAESERMAPSGEKHLEDIEETSNYDYKAAKESSKFYIKEKGEEILYLDPETGIHISKDEFLKKYTEEDIRKIERLHKLGN